MSRDIFTNAMNPGYDGIWSCVAAQHQSSLVGIVAPAVPIADEDLVGMKPRDQWILREDCEKDFLAKLRATQPRVLLVDFWADVFFGFRRIGSTYITDNDWTLPQSPFLRRIQREESTEALSIEDAPDAYLARWRIAARTFRRFVDENLPDTLVVLHRGAATDTFLEAERGVTLTASGSCIPRDVHRLNRLWARLDDLAAQELTEHVLDLGGDRYPSTTVHRWGAGYVHYVDAYYSDALDRLRGIVAAADRGTAQFGRLGTSRVS